MFLALTFGFCAVIYMRHARRPVRLRTLLRFLLPRRVFLHASAKLDYKYYFVMTALRAGMLGGMVVSSAAVAGALMALLTSTFGAPQPIAAPLYLTIPIATVLQVVLFDLGFWVGTWVMTKIQLIWWIVYNH